MFRRRDIWKSLGAYVSSTASDAPDDAVWAAALAAVVVLIVAMVTVAAPLAHVLLGRPALRFFPSASAEVRPKPAESMRYLLAVVGVIGFAFAVAVARRRGGGRPWRHLRAVSVAAKLCVVGVAVWAWVGQYDGLLTRQVPRSHLAHVDLVYAVLVGALAFAMARAKPRWFVDRAACLPRRWWIWLIVTVGLTACWLAPDFFQGGDLGSGLDPHDLLFTFNNEFLAPLAGRTPLVNYDPQYSMLLGLAAEPVFEVLGARIGVFSGLMCLLSLVALVAVQRTLVMLTRSQPLALALYVPWLAISLYTVIEAGSERFNFGNYYAVFPLRYGGPYVLLYLCARHLSGRAPRTRWLLFLVAGLVALNNLEFGLPAFGALVVALGAAQARGTSRKLASLALLRDAAIGTGVTIALLVALTLLRAGQLPDFRGLVRLQLLYGTAGFYDLPTPTAGLHLIMYMTFGAALLTAAVRWRRGHPDRALTGVLAYSGVFGLGAGAYYMGRSHPDVQISIFSAWGLSIVLLALLALRSAAGQRRRLIPSFAGAAVLFLFGLIATAVVQFPPPWQQLGRIDATAASFPADRKAAVAFVERTSHPGEHVVVLAGLSFLIARDAHVTNVTPYGDVAPVVTYQQLDEILTALRRAGGSRFYLAAHADDPVDVLPAWPEISAMLTRRGFAKVAYDSASQLTEWQVR